MNLQWATEPHPGMMKATNPYSRFDVATYPS